MGRRKIRVVANAEPIIKSVGATESERFLADLCESTFLSLWSYPSVFRDQGLRNGGDGKEVADLLVVFDDHVVVFSDKHCSFPGSGTIERDWARWFKNAIGSATKQLWGAERWIRTHPDRLFLDRKCTQRFPVPLPLADQTMFHLVVVAHGSAQRGVEEVGGSGGLMFRSSMHGLSEHAKTPLTVGDLDPNHTFVHVFDDVALPIVLQSLDTIADFTRYLDQKAAFCRSQTELIARSEQDLLVLYLRHENANDTHEFVPTADADYVVVDDGFWDIYAQSAEYARKEERNKISYLWDSLIEDLAAQALSGTHEFTPGATFGSADRILRFLAREPRARRRVLARASGRHCTNPPRQSGDYVASWQKARVRPITSTFSTHSMRATRMRGIGSDDNVSSRLAALSIGSSIRRPWISSVSLLTRTWRRPRARLMPPTTTAGLGRPTMQVARLSYSVPSTSTSGPSCGG
jgi:hypothetical protein